MPKTGFTIGRILTMALFALSCFGLLLFLWLSFGGAAPLKPKGYRVDVLLDEATQLAEQADVRVSGVPIGKVVAQERDGDRTRATLQLQSKYAPLPADTKVVARQKTLLGETYIELTPGTRRAAGVPEGGTLGRAQSQSTVELDEVLRAFDEPSRRNLSAWLKGWSQAVDGRSEDINDAVGSLEGAVVHGGDVLGTFAAQRDAVQRLVRDAGTVFSTIGRRDAATRELVTAGDLLLRTTAARRDDLRATTRALPPFVAALRDTANETTSLTRQLLGPVRQLRPVAKALPSTLRGSGRLGDDLEAISGDLDRVIDSADDGLPAASALLRAAGPLLDRLDPLSSELQPITAFLASYRKEITQSWPKAAAATNDTAPTASGREAHYLRLLAPITTEALGIQGRMNPTDRANPYPAPGAIGRVAANGTLEAFDCSHTSNPVSVPALGSAPPCLQQEPYEVGGAPGKSRFPKLQRAR